MKNPLKYLHLIFACIFLISACTWYQEAHPNRQASRWPVIQASNQVGLRAVDCWFGYAYGLPPTECYEMQVHEGDESANSQFITFPVLVFRSEMGTGTKSPLLHLGAGGPGAPMYLNYPSVVKDLVRSLWDASLGQGRDLVVIDPRGTGLARPRLTCDTFIKGERKRLRQSLALPEIISTSVADYRTCIDSFIKAGVNLENFNSFAVAKDVEALRQTAGIERWVLLGVSYGANYALTIADKYPGAVESIVLDSSFISRIGLHEYYIEQTVRPYQMLFNYCRYDPNCARPIANVERRFWDLFRNLNRRPIWVELNDIDNRTYLPVLLDGERFLSAITEGSYDVEIFKDFPRIITELEAGYYDSLWPYLWQHVDFMLDPYWGDVSGMAHYCYEEKPQINFSLIRKQFDRLPPGYLRDSAPLLLDWPDHCEQMRIRETAPHLIPSRRVTTPVLFLHGNFDSVAPVTNVRKVLHFFDNAHLLTFNLGHDILADSYCARKSMAIFIDNPYLSQGQIKCY